MEVDYRLKVPGFAEPFLPRDMRFDPDAGILYLKAPGITPFYETDGIRVAILDLEVPAIMRQELIHGGWLELAMSEFISVLRFMNSVVD